MKIPASIRRVYEDQKAINDRLKTAIDERMRGIKEPRWHYESRVKELPSFALKLETGRVQNPAAMEDFFASTLVVTNTAEISTAEQLVSEQFTIRSKRPPRPDRTHKRSYAFEFDDLRLYACIGTNPAFPRTDLDEVVFEVQLKTFLQHAWSIATHDLLYKTADPNWSKERIAYQVKAMLEHAEISIQEAENLASCAALLKEDRETITLKEGIALVKGQWKPDELPSDVRRLAMNITELLDALRLDIARLEQILNERKHARAGAHPSNLSPYSTVVQYLCEAQRSRMLTLLSNEKSRRKVMIPQELELPAGVDKGKLKNAIIVE